MAEVVARARSARGEIVLRRRDPPRDGASAPLELRVNGVFVMDTVHTDTEERLAREALARSPAPTGCSSVAWASASPCGHCSATTGSSM